MITLTFDKREFDKLSEKLSRLSPTAQNSITRQAFTELTTETEGQLLRNVSGKILHVRSHGLAGSIGSRVYQEGNTLVGIVGSGARQGGSGRMPYANIHETGGVIKPKKGKFLWIPIRAGSDFAMNLVGDRSIGGLSLSKAGFSRKDGKIIGKSYSSKILKWIPVRQVTIPARRYMSRTAEEIAPRISEIMNRSIERQLGK